MLLAILWPYVIDWRNWKKCSYSGSLGHFTELRGRGGLSNGEQREGAVLLWRSFPAGSAGADLHRHETAAAHETGPRHVWSSVWEAAGTCPKKLSGLILHTVNSYCRNIRISSMFILPLTSLKPFIFDQRFKINFLVNLFFDCMKLGLNKWKI